MTNDLDTDLAGSLQWPTGIAIHVRAQALGSLFLVGSALSLPLTIAPHSRPRDLVGLLVTIALSFATGAGVLVFARRLREAALRVLVALGTTAIAVAAVCSGETPCPTVFFFLWVFMYSAYFFTCRQALAQGIYAAVAYAVLLVAVPPGDGGRVMWWLSGMGASLAAGILVASMRRRVETLIARLFKAARADPLTRLPNRLRFRELLDLELERARRSQGPVAILVGNLDGFNAVNDRGGHHAGDELLQHVARLLVAEACDACAVARIGGDEFALVLPAIGRDDALAAAERLRAAVSAAAPLTISFGVGAFPADGETASSLLRAADEALFDAKASGGDRSVLHDRAFDGLSRGASERHLGEEHFLAVMVDLAEAADLRFSGSARHSETVARYAETMARELGLPERRVARVRIAGLLHDIGKVAISDELLQKPGRLTDEEFETIRSHPGLGAEMLQHPSLADVREWVLTHHERPDGRGYPRGLAGDEIALEARIVAVADAYEAMTSDRSYRRSIGKEAACAELRRHAGTQFDADVVEALLTVLAHDVERADAPLAR